MARRTAIVPIRIAAVAAIKTLIQLVAPTNQKLIVVEVGISFDGTSNTAVPIDCGLLRQTTAGTMTAATPVQLDPDVTGVLQATAQTNATVEPTSGNQLHRWHVHPQAGLIWVPPPGFEVYVQAAGRLGLTILTAPASVDADAYIVFEE